MERRPVIFFSNSFNASAECRLVCFTPYTFSAKCFISCSVVNGITSGGVGFEVSATEDVVTGFGHLNNYTPAKNAAGIGCRSFIL
jgi:hypothetical protein